MAWVDATDDFLANRCVRAFTCDSQLQNVGTIMSHHCRAYIAFGTMEFKSPHALRKSRPIFMYLAVALVMSIPIVLTHLTPRISSFKPMATTMRLVA